MCDDDRFVCHCTCQRSFRSLRRLWRRSGMMFQAGPACLPVACRSFFRLDGFIGRWLGLSLSDEPVRNG